MKLQGAFHTKPSKISPTVFIIRCYQFSSFQGAELTKKSPCKNVKLALTGESEYAAISLGESKYATIHDAVRANEVSMQRTCRMRAVNDMNAMLKKLFGLPLLISGPEERL